MRKIIDKRIYDIDAKTSRKIVTHYGPYHPSDFRCFAETETFDKIGNPQNFNSLKKYFKGYIAGFDGAKNLRERLMGAESAAEVRKIIKDFLKAIPLKNSAILL